MLNQGQMILLIPMIGSYVPEEFIDFNRVISPCLGNYPVFIHNILAQIFVGINDHRHKQTDWYLRLIGVESQSTLYNLTGVLFIFLVAMVLHFLVYLLNDLSLEAKGRSKYYKLIYFLVNWFTYRAYLRIFMFLYIFFLLASIHEIKATSNWNIDSTSYFSA